MEQQSQQQQNRQNSIRQISPLKLRTLPPQTLARQSNPLYSPQPQPRIQPVKQILPNYHQQQNLIRSDRKIFAPLENSQQIQQQFPQLRQSHSQDNLTRFQTNFQPFVAPQYSQQPQQIQNINPVQDILQKYTTNIIQPQQYQQPQQLPIQPPIQSYTNIQEIEQPQIVEPQVPPPNNNGIGQSVLQYNLEQQKKYLDTQEERLDAQKYQLQHEKNSVTKQLDDIKVSQQLQFPLAGGQSEQKFVTPGNRTKFSTLQKSKIIQNTLNENNQKLNANNNNNQNNGKYQFVSAEKQLQNRSSVKQFHTENLETPQRNTEQQQKNLKQMFDQGISTQQNQQNNNLQDQLYNYNDKQQQQNVQQFQHYNSPIRKLEPMRQHYSSLQMSPDNTHIGQKQNMMQQQQQHQQQQPYYSQQSLPFHTKNSSLSINQQRSIFPTTNEQPLTLSHHQQLQSYPKSYSQRKTQSQLNPQQQQQQPLFQYSGNEQPITNSSYRASNNSLNNYNNQQQYPVSPLDGQLQSSVINHRKPKVFSDKQYRSIYQDLPYQIPVKVNGVPQQQQQQIQNQFQQSHLSEPPVKKVSFPQPLHQNNSNKVLHSPLYEQEQFHNQYNLQRLVDSQDPNDERDEFEDLKRLDDEFSNDDFLHENKPTVLKELESEGGNNINNNMVHQEEEFFEPQQIQNQNNLNAINAYSSTPTPAPVQKNNLQSKNNNNNVNNQEKDKNKSKQMLYLRFLSFTVFFAMFIQLVFTLIK